MLFHCKMADVVSLQNGRCRFMATGQGGLVSWLSGSRGGKYEGEDLGGDKTTEVYKSGLEYTRQITEQTAAQAVWRIIKARCNDIREK